MKRYSLDLNIRDNETGEHIVNIGVSDRTMEVVQQLIRISMQDLTKVPVNQPKRKLFGKSKQYTPPLDPTAICTAS